MIRPLCLALMLWIMPGVVWLLSGTTVLAFQRAEIEFPEGHATAVKSMHIFIGTYTRERKPGHLSIENRSGNGRPKSTLKSSLASFNIRS